MTATTVAVLCRAGRFVLDARTLEAITAERIANGESDARVSAANADESWMLAARLLLTVLNEVEP